MSQTSLQALQVSYFGKLPSRGDFVKGSYNPQLLSALDAWVSQGMEMLSEDPRWKLIYDCAAPIDFACLGSRSKLAIAGHVRPSHDESLRRYPFLVVVPFEVERPAEFVAGAPAMLQPFWDTSSRNVDQLKDTSDLEAELKKLEATPLTLGAASPDPGQSLYLDFVRQTSLLRVEQLLNFNGQKVATRRLLLALGLLLQPVAASTAAQLEKGLSLPLPRERSAQALVATFWLDIVSQFFKKADVELLVCITKIAGLPRLIIGFNGLSHRTLHSIMHPQAYAEQNIEVDNPEWVEESIHSNYAMYKLVSYLDQAQLPLDIIRSAFCEVFIGE